MEWSIQRRFTKGLEEEAYAPVARFSPMLFETLLASKRKLFKVDGVVSSSHRRGIRSEKLGR